MKKYTVPQQRDIRRTMMVLRSAAVRLESQRLKLLGQRVNALASEIDGLLRAQTATEAYPDSPPVLSFEDSLFGESVPG